MKENKTEEKKMPKEIRQLEIDDIELRSDDDSESFVEGVGIVYDREVELWPGYFEKIRSGAFESSVRGDKDIKSFFNHNPSFVLSTTRSRPPLILDDGSNGLRFKSPIPDTSYGRDLRENLRRKNVRGASFSFTVARDGDSVTRDEKGNIRREITKGTLYEIGPVTNPAYKQTKVGLRDAETAYKEYCEDFERRSAEEAQEMQDRESAAAEMESNRRFLDIEEATL